MTKVESSAYYVVMVSAEIAGEIEAETHPVTSMSSESARGMNRWWSFRNSAIGAFTGTALAAAALGVVVVTNESLSESADLAKILLGTGIGVGTAVGGVRRLREKINTGFWSILQRIPRRPEISW